MAEDFDSYQTEKPSYEMQRQKRERSNRLIKRFVIIGASLLAASFLVIVVLEEGFGFSILFRSKDAWEMLTYRNETPSEVYSAVYYSGHVTKDEAKRLGAFFQQRGFFRRPDSVAMVLSKKGNTYVISFFVGGSFRMEDVRPEFEEFRQAASRELFGGEDVIIQLCEQKVIPTGSHPELQVRATIP